MAKSTEKRSEAIEWLIGVQQAQEPSQSDVEKWEQWIADPEHQAMFDSTVELWERTGSVGPLPVPDPEELAADDYDGSETIAAWSERRAAAVHEGAEEDSDRRGNEAQERHAISAPQPSTSQPWRWRRRFAVAAAAAIVLMAWIIYPQIGSQSTELRLYETRLAEHRVIQLDDGSQLFLGARTSLWVTYTHHRRIVVLDRGQALFDVARDPQRPFVVHAGYGSVTAVGTSFSVQRDREYVEVTVAEGVVRVEPRTADASKVGAVGEPPVVATLTRGQQVSYDEGGSGEISIVGVDPDLATAWRDGRLQYIDEPLRSVVADVNRYSRRQIVLNGTQAQDLRFTGMVFQANADQWPDQLLDIFPALEIVETNADHVVLRANPANRKPQAVR